MIVDLSKNRQDSRRFIWTLPKNRMKFILLNFTTRVDKRQAMPIIHPYTSSRTNPEGAFAHRSLPGFRFSGTDSLFSFSVGFFQPPCPLSRSPKTGEDVAPQQPDFTEKEMKNLRRLSPFYQGVLARQAHKKTHQTHSLRRLFDHIGRAEI